MYTKDIEEHNLVDGKIDVNKYASTTVVRFHGSGSCKIRAVWEDNVGDTHAEKKDLNATTYQIIKVRIDAIEISEKSGDGTVIIESIFN